MQSQQSCQEHGHWQSGQNPLNRSECFKFGAITHYLKTRGFNKSKSGLIIDSQHETAKMVEGKFPQPSAACEVRKNDSKSQVLCLARGLEYHLQRHEAEASVVWAKLTYLRSASGAVRLRAVAAGKVTFGSCRL